jgi:DNA-binding response OmpR family regulator
MTRLILADDDPNVTGVVARYLEFQGFEVRTVGNGAEAVDAVLADAPDILLIDIMMPEVDGLEAVRRIRQEASLAGLPILVFSALSEKSDEVAEAGADGLITKPYNLADLVERIRTTLG